MPAINEQREVEHHNHLNPTAADIFDALARAFDNPKSPHHLCFHMQSVDGSTASRQLLIQVTCVEYESGSPGMLKIMGNVMEGISAVGDVWKGRVVGVYNAKDHRGRFQRKS